MSADEGQEELEEVQAEIKRKDEEVSIDMDLILCFKLQANAFLQV